MSIIVVCPGCRKSFSVSDKFAGKSGPCPKCKRTLRVPEKSEEVQVHAPTEFAGGGRSRSGKLVTKPVARAYAKFKPVTTVSIVAGTLAVLVIAWVAGRTGAFENILVTTIGLLAISTPLVVAAYGVLHDDELEPYAGKALYIRSALCGLAYAVLWGVFTLLVSRGVITGDLWNWLFVAPPFLMVGGMFALATLDLEFGDAMFHYAFYLLATIILRWAAGMPWVWDITTL